MAKFPSRLRKKSSVLRLACLPMAPRWDCYLGFAALNVVENGIAV